MRGLRWWRNVYWFLERGVGVVVEIFEVMDLGMEIGVEVWGWGGGIMVGGGCGGWGIIKLICCEFGAGDVGWRCGRELNRSL